MRKITLILVAIAMAGPAIAAETLREPDVAKIHEAHDANEARFVRDYKDRSLMIKAYVTNIAENNVFAGRFSLSAALKPKKGFFSRFGDVSCKVDRKEDIALISNFNVGDEIMVAGNIADYSYGEIILTSCAFQRLSWEVK